MNRLSIAIFSIQGMNWWTWCRARPVCFLGFKNQRNPYPLLPAPARVGQVSLRGQGSLGWFLLPAALPCGGPQKTDRGGQGMHTQASKQDSQAKGKVRTKVIINITLLQAKRTRPPSQTLHNARQKDMYYWNLLHYSRPGMSISVIGLVI